MADIDVDDLIKKLKQLKKLREKLLKSDLSPEGAWIHHYQIHRNYPSGCSATYTYAKWQADKPIFKRNPKKNARLVKPGKSKEYTNHQHIGNVETNPDVQEAYRRMGNRERLERIEKALFQIDSILNLTDF
jgi:hypothetical protein